jgi:hypothetical protein
MNDFLQLIPEFTAGVTYLHNILAPVVLVLMFAGLMIKVAQAQQQRCLSSLWPLFVRMGAVSILVGSLITWGNLLQSGVNDLISQLGLTQVSGNVYQAYRTAVAARFGSDNMASNATLQGVTSKNFSSQAPFNVTAEGDTSGGITIGQSTGIKLNHFAYEKPGDLNYDSNSPQGVGAFDFDSAPGSMVPLESAAVSADVAAKYNLQPGQLFTITTANGPMTLQYADKTADWVTGSVDVYDPNNVLGDNQLTGITSLNGGQASATAGPSATDWLSNPVGTLQKFVIDRLVWLLSLAALGIMWLMSCVQQILYLIEIAISPIFLGCLVVPPLISIGARFLSSLVAICLWPLGWAVCDLVTRLLINVAVNPTNDPGLATFGTGAMLLGYWILLAIWVIGSSLAGPWIISRSLMAGSSEITAVLGGTLGVAAASVPRMAYRAAMLSAGAGALGGGNGSIAPISPASASLMTPYQNFARRPISKPEARENI